MRNTTIIGIALVSVGAVLFTVAFVKFGPWDYQPLCEPLPLSSGSIRTASFDVDLDGPYVLYTLFDRAPMDNPPWEDRDWTPSRISWTITSEDQPVAEGRSRDSVWGSYYAVDHIGQSLGTFQLTHGKEYQLRFEVNSVDEALDALSPRICVRSDMLRDPFHSRGHLFGYIVLVAGFSSLVGAVNFGVSLMHRYRAPW